MIDIYPENSNIVVHINEQNVNEFNLDNLPDWVQAFSEHQLLFYAEACVAALESQGHFSGITIQLEGEFHDKVRVIWRNKSKNVGVKDPRDWAEIGAIALAFCVVVKFSEYNVIEQSVIGTGFDYWLGYKENVPNQNPDNFLNARLEISGMLKGNNRDVATRLRQKIRQTGISDYMNIPAIIVIVEFSTPLSLTFVK